MKHKTAIVTGTKEFSLGESIVLNLQSAVPDINIITISRTANESLNSKLGEQGFFIQMDLNPHNHGKGDRALDNFQSSLYHKIRMAFVDFEKRGRLSHKGIDFLFNNAGVYDFGPLTKISNKSISNLVGVNYVGHLMVAKTVMILNEDNGINNSTDFRLCEVGSFQGLRPRTGRSVYSPSKAAGIDACHSLADGNEVEVVSYIAVGPIDTYMLHANHWETKSGGSKEFIDQIFDSDKELYKSIFVDGNMKSFENCLSNFKKVERDKLKETYSKYLKVREKYAKTETLAIESAEDVAKSIVSRMLQPADTLPSDILFFDKQWNGKEFFKGYSSVPFKDYDKLERIFGPCKELTLDLKPRE